MQMYTYLCYDGYFVPDIISVAIDMSHAQNSTLEIKIAGIKNLKFSDFLKLLGVTSGSEDER